MVEMVFLIIKKKNKSWNDVPQEYFNIFIKLSNTAIILYFFQK